MLPHGGKGSSVYIYLPIGDSNNIAIIVAIMCAVSVMASVNRWRHNSYCGFGALFRVMTIAFQFIYIIRFEVFCLCSVFFVFLFCFYFVFIVEAEFCLVVVFSSFFCCPLFRFALVRKNIFNSSVHDSMKFVRMFWICGFFCYLYFVVYGVWKMIF